MRIILSGCSKGIGKALLIKLLENEHEVVSISRSKTDLSGLLNTSVIKWYEIQGDILDKEVHSKLEEILNDWGHADVLINNAGLLINKAFNDISYSDYQKSFDVNYYGPLKLSQIVIPYMLKSTFANHINIGSIGGVQGSLKFPGLSVYSSSKGALSILTECLAEEFKGSPIHFNCLALGAVQTEMLAQAFPGYTAPFSPAQMAEYIVNFMESSSYMMNGKIISVSASNP